jgi:hypothetical protein
MADDMDVNTGRILEGTADLKVRATRIHSDYKSFEPIGPACLPAVV